MRELRKALLIFSAILWITLIAAYALTMRVDHGRIYDFTGHLIGVDFLNSWSMGNLARTETAPQMNYAMAHYNETLRPLLRPNYFEQLWSYPPTYVLAMIPFGLLPYEVALGVAMLLGIACLAAAIRGISHEHWRQNALTILCAPASLLALICGQLAFYFAALQLAFFRLLDSNPYGAGVLLGLLSIKPQLGLVYPFYLLATRRWKTMFTAAITVFALIAFSALCLGSEMWNAYWNIAMPAQFDQVLRFTPVAVSHLMPTVFMDAKVAGAPLNLALALQACVAIVALAALFTPRFRALDLAHQMPIAAAASLLVTPYCMAYDLVFFTAACLLSLDTLGHTRKGKILACACLWLPLLYLLASLIPIPGTSLIPLLLIVFTLKRA